MRLRLWGRKMLNADTSSPEPKSEAPQDDRHRYIQRMGYERGFIPPEPPGKRHDRERMKSRTAWIAGAVLLIAAAAWFAIAVLQIF